MTIPKSPKRSLCRRSAWSSHIRCCNGYSYRLPSASCDKTRLHNKTTFGEREHSHSIQRKHIWLGQTHKNTLRPNYFMPPFWQAILIICFSRVAIPGALPFPPHNSQNRGSFGFSACISWPFWLVGQGPSGGKQECPLVHKCYSCGSNSECYVALYTLPVVGEESSCLATKRKVNRKSSRKTVAWHWSLQVFTWKAAWATHTHTVDGGCSIPYKMLIGLALMLK